MNIIMKSEEERTRYFNESFEKRMEEHRKHGKKHREKHKDKIRKRSAIYNESHKEHIAEWMKKYQKTEKGRLVYAKASRRRKSQLGFHPISFPLNVTFDWHHVNSNDVVAIQRYIHRAICHKCGDRKLEGVSG